MSELGDDATVTKSDLPQVPIAAVRPSTSRHHGIQRVDDYEWLRDKESPDVIGYLEAENAYTQARTEHLAALRERLFNETKDRTRETDLSVPSRNRGYWWYGRTFEGREYGATCRAPVADESDWNPPRPADCAPDQPALPGEEVLLDLDQLADGHEFFSLGGAAVSLDTNFLAYSIDTSGDERYTVRIKDLRTGDLLADELTGVLGGATWSRDGADLYYTTCDESWRADKIWRHRVGTAQNDDELVFHETDTRFWVGVGRSRCDRFLIIHSGAKTTSESRYLDQNAPDQGWQVFHPRVDDLEYGIEPATIDGRDVFVVLHNATGADFEVGVSPLQPSPPTDWTPLIAHDPSVRLEAVDAFATHLIVQQRSGGLTQVRILRPTEPGEMDDHLVSFPDEIYTVGAGSTPAYDSPRVRLGYTTLAIPASVIEYDVPTQELVTLKQTEVLPTPQWGEFDADAYEEHRLWAEADDGVRIPISIVARRDHRARGPLPVLLYGYGSYEASIDPYFSVSRLSLLDRGAAFAIAHVRGGGEMGRAWYDNGKMLTKRNTFSDFVACAQHLVATGWARPDGVVAEGGSAGGLLMGAVVNLAPEAFAGVVAAVPFVDPLTTMLDASLPLTVIEYDEWGNPEEDPQTYDYLASYAPYDNVSAVDYPPILAETSLNDTRVLYVEPAKWIAKLRATATGRRDFLLKTEMSAGHGGISGRYRAWQDRAFSLAWILDRMGLADEPDPT